MDRIPDEVSVYNEAAEEAVELGNRIAADDTEMDVWEEADGILAGANQ